MLVLADGRFHEKAALQRAVREAAAERGVMLAFIILDNPAASLLDMQTVRAFLMILSVFMTTETPQSRESISVNISVKHIINCFIEGTLFVIAGELRGRQASVHAVSGQLPLPILHCTTRCCSTSTDPG